MCQIADFDGLLFVFDGLADSIGRFGAKGTQLISLHPATGIFDFADAGIMAHTIHVHTAGCLFRFDLIKVDGSIHVIIPHDTGELGIIFVHHLDKGSCHDETGLIVTVPQAVNHALFVTFTGEILIAQSCDIAGIDQLCRIGYIQVIGLEVVGNNAGSVVVQGGHIPVNLMVKGIGEADHGVVVRCQSGIALFLAPVAGITGIHILL